MDTQLENMEKLLNLAGVEYECEESYGEDGTWTGYNISLSPEAYIHFNCAGKLIEIVTL